MRYVVAVAILLGALLPYVVGQRAYLALAARPTAAYMRYCAAPGGIMPMHPCADDEDEDEVIQA